ncbi:GtrA family protein [Streptomyces sp. 8N114]|uniref:GtrA family protein n=1 Tax=Streptomyces sp. 8N114 TaxID=3457419 RepID=UPI003FD0B8AF
MRPGLERLVRELAKFGAVGALGFLVNVAIFNLCIHTFQLAPIRSGVISQVVAIGTNYLGNRYWTYRHIDKSRIHRETVLFFLFSGVGLVLENGILALSHYGFGYTSPLADNIAKNVIGLAIGTAFRFWAYRTWVFRVGAQTGTDTDAEADGEPSPRLRPGGAPSGRVPVEPATSAGGGRIEIGGLAAEEQREDRRQLLK